MKFTEECLLVSPTPLKLAEELAAWFFARVHEKILHKKNFYVAISGGSTPVLFFNQLASVYGHHIDWSFVHIFWVDEKCVHPANNESNYKTAHINLLSKIHMPADNIHRIRGENEPAKEALRYADEIAGLLPFSDDVPCFDLVMLGLGDNGHTASIFPGQNHLIFSGNLVETSVNPDTNQSRISLTPYCINNSAKIVFQVTGMAKSKMVNDILLHTTESKEYPAAHINPVKGDLYWFIDAGASKGIFT